MKKIIKLCLSSILIFSIFAGFNWQIVFAEDLIPSETQPAEPDLSSPNSDSPASSEPQNEEAIVVDQTDQANPTDPIVEDASSVEQAVGDPTVQDTVSPQGDSLSVDDIISIPEDTEITKDENNSNDFLSTEDTTPSVIDNEEEKIIIPEEVKDENLIEEESVLEETVEEKEIIEEDKFTVEIKKPKPIYSFSLSRKTIPTKRFDHVKEKRFALNSQGKKIISTEEKIIENTVTDKITPDINESTGNMVLSGSCSSKYFVVLVYKNESDYSDNQNSYILNKAFDCIDGKFNYEVSRLPENLTDGTYYVLIGEQGDTGTWKPISQLSEVNLNRN